jgi:hypothetical protein
MLMSSYTTGSDELTPILLIPPTIANDEYGVDIQYANNCPNCKASIHQPLSYNSQNSYYYLTCPVCGKTMQYLDNTGALSDFSFVTSRKTTPLDIDKDFPDYY